MESPKTGIVLLALVAVATASGGTLGWTLRAQGTPGESVKMLAPKTPGTSVVQQEGEVAVLANTPSAAAKPDGAPDAASVR